MIPRKLRGETIQGPIDFDQSDLLTRTELLIVLGEAGMGKTELTRYLGTQDGFVRCTARQLINRHNPQDLLSDAQVIVIDALDEVGTHKEGEAVDLVLQALGRIGYPKFILSCRVSDWRSATGRSAIHDQYGSEPLELHLNPFTSQDVLTFLKLKLGDKRALEVVEHFGKKGIADLLGNPQTLLMIASVAKEKTLPTSLGGLFESFVDVAWSEHSDLKTSSTLITLGPDAVCTAVGAGFCALIMTGSDSLSRRPRSVALESGDLPIAEVAALPGAAVLPEILDSRLFYQTESEKFTYPHRRIGEFLGAQWLARQADTPRKRRRLLAQFRTHGLVPASLRGIHAWLAWHDQKLSESVIEIDPMGLIEYGDADELNVVQGKALIASLETLAANNPRFVGWGPYSIRGIVNSELIDDLRRVITNAETPFGLRLLAINGVINTPVALLLVDELLKTLMDTSAAFAIRNAAAEALIKFDQLDVWPTRLQILHNLADESSLRLALQIFSHIGFTNISNQLVTDIICAQVGISLCPIPKTNRERTVGLFHGLQRDLPDERIQGILNCLSEYAISFFLHDYDRHDDFAEIYLELIARHITLGNTDSLLLWRWLKPIKNDGMLRASVRGTLALALNDNNQLRRAVQKQVLLHSQDDKNIWQRSFSLLRRSNGFSVTFEDAIVLLSELHPEDFQTNKWKEIVSLVRHSETEGFEVREAARTYLLKQETNLESIAWIEELCKEKIQEWQVEEEERRKTEAERKEREWNEHRIWFKEHIKEMRSGDYGSLISPAKVYLKLFNDINEDLPAHERIPDWLGNELANAAYEGFENFLLKETAEPSIKEISESHAQGQHWDVGYIVVAGLAERFRAGNGFSDLSAEKLISGFYELLQHRIDSHANIDGLSEAVEENVRGRGLWPSAIQGWIEPQLQYQKTYVDGLHNLMYGDDSDVATTLAKDWLGRFVDMPVAAEIDMVDRLIHSSEKDYLTKLAEIRQKTGNLDDERRRLWDAVDLIVNFDAAISRLEAKGPIEPELIWHIRARIGHQRRSLAILQLHPKQIAWIVSNFRSSWPLRYRPSGVTNGDNNAWDASDFLRTLINALGDDISEDAIAFITKLREESSDDYIEHLQTVTWEQARKKVENLFEPLTLNDLSSLVRDAIPTDAISLQAVLVEELSVLQRKLKTGGDATEPHRGFYSDGKPLAEEICRDHLLLLLQQIPFDIVLRPEGHVANDKEIDIECTLGRDLMVPIEIKGQWHKDLWHAADTQLARLYATDWRADRRGIYLILWFGNKGKQLAKPPKGNVIPQSPEALREMLIEHSYAAQENLVEVVVLDLTRT